MGMFSGSEAKPQDAVTVAQAVEAEAAASTGVAAAKLPPGFDTVLGEVGDEWTIFETRLQRFMTACSSGASEAEQRRCFTHAKHAAMTVRDALKRFGKLSV